MAKYHLTTNDDGSMSLRAELSTRDRVFYRTAVAHFPKDDLLRVTLEAAEKVKQARVKHGLSKVDGDVPGRTG